MTACKDHIRNFYNGKLFPILVAALIFLGHATGKEILFGAILLLSLIPACFLCTDLRFAMLPVLCLIFLVSPGDYKPNDTGYTERYLNAPVLITVAVVGTLFVAALVWFCIKNRKKTNRLSCKGMLLSLSVFCAALLINGIFSQNYTPKNLLFAGLITLILFFVYVLFSLYLRFDAALLERFMYLLVIAGLLICAELLHAYFTIVQFENGAVVKGSVVLGWGVWTTIGGMLTFLMPASFYFAASAKHGWIAYLIGVFELFCILLSQSRGALLIGALIFALCHLYLCLRGKNRKQNRIFTLLLCGCALIGGVLFFDKIRILFEEFLKTGFGDNGRFEIWSIGINHFLDYPVFGSGFYDSYTTIEWERAFDPYLYHNTLIQMLGCAGIVGLAAYLYHRVSTVILVIRRPNPTKTFLGFCILGLLLCSLTDVLFFKLYPSIFYAFMLLFMEQSEQVS